LRWLLWQCTPRGCLGLFRQAVLCGIKNCLPNKQELKVHLEEKMLEK
jgi:hypothetical protein